MISCNSAIGRWGFDQLCKQVVKNRNKINESKGQNQVKKNN